MNSNPSNMSAEDFTAYLAKHGITDYKKNWGGTEISFPCPFHGCDDDKRRTEEYHCSFNLEKCVYQCFKCGEKGNFVTLQKHFGDYEKKTATKKKRESLDAKAERWNKALPEEMRHYFNMRGINDESIAKHKLGYGEYNNKHWLTIPIFDKDGKVAYFKLRKLPDDNSDTTPKYTVYPYGVSVTLCGIKELLESKSNDVMICEGELDRIVALQNGVNMPVITAGGATIFKEEWLPYLKDMRNIYICLDSDETGEKASSKLVELFSEKIPEASVFKVSIPYEYGIHADMTDYFTTGQGTVEGLFKECTEWVGGAEPIDESKFEEMSVEDIIRVLDLTIKHDDANKAITFLAMLLTYTDSDALNVMFNAGSSTGKTYICNEVSKLFPANDVKSYGKISPTAFYYNENLMRKDPETDQMYIDLERRILIFTEQPNTQLLENLRAFLSHDSKRTPFAITNKGKNGANKATEGYILGFASTFFCTANMRIDEQEQTRSLILSPESTREKIEAGIDTSIDKNSNKEAYNATLDASESRKLLMDRIRYIKALNVKDIDIEDKEYLKRCFMSRQRNLASRNQRDIAHFMSLAKAMALLNAPFRKRGNKIVATNNDINEAMKLWGVLSESMFYGVSPQVLDYYKNYILPAHYELNKNSSLKREDWFGMTYDDFSRQYFQRAGSYPNWDNFRKMIIPALQCASLISYERDENDRRNKLIKPLVFFD